MKTVFLIMFVSIFLTSCGEQVGTAKLKVTSSMALTNSAFTGGLLIQGFGPNNAHFSKYIAYSASSPSELTVPLAYGVWNFRTIGWTGTSKFNGPVKCATASANLGSSESVVELVAETSKCDANFGDANYTNSVGNFKDLHIVTCGQYHKADGTLVSIGSDKYFCNNSSPLPASAKIWAASASIAPLNKLPSGTWTRDDANKTCLTGSEGILSPASALNIPSKGVPVEITLYSSNNCLGDINILNSYHLFRGFQFDYMTDLDAKVHQDKKFLNGSTENVLFLTTSNLKRGTSSFMDLLPSINCAGLACFDLPQMPTTPSGVKFAGRSGSRYLIRKERTLAENCDTFDWIAHAELDEAQSSCHEEDYGEDRKSIFVDIRFNQDNCGEGVGGCDFQYKFGTGALETIKVVTVTSGLNDIYHQIFDGPGHQSQLPYPFAFDGVNQMFPSLSYAQEDFGKLRKVRDMFLPDGPAGVLGNNITCDTSMNVDKMISFFEEGQWKTYQVVVQGRSVSGATDSIPSFICNDQDSTPSVCPTGVANYYDATMTSRKKVGVEFVTESVMKFHCSRKLGELESHEIDSEKKNKEIIYWNTNDDLYSRYEMYSFDQETSNGVLQEGRTEYERVEKVAGSKFNISSLRFETRLESDGKYNQRAERRDTAAPFGENKIGSIKVESSYNSTTAEGPYSLFNDGVFKAEKDKTIFPWVISSPNNHYHIKAEAVGSDLVVKNVLTGTTMDTFSTGVTTNINIKASINNSGNIVVCWINEDSGNIKGHARVFDGTVWTNFDSTSDISAHYTDDIDCKINDTGIVTVAARVRDNPATEYNNTITLFMGPIGGAIASMTSSSASYKDFAIEILDNGKTGIVFAQATMIRYADAGYLATPAVDFNWRGSISGASVMPGLNALYDIEFTENSASQPHFTIAWQTSTNQNLDVWKLTTGATLSLVKNYTQLTANPPAINYSVQGYDCVSTASAVLLNVPTNNPANCPSNMFGSLAPPIKSTYFHNNLKTLSPTVFEANFTSEAAFKIK